MTAPTLTLRTATPADLAAVDALFARSYPTLLRPDYPPSVMVTAVPRLARAQPRLLASGRYFLAEDAAGNVLGAGGWSAGAGRRAEVRHVVTDHRHVRQGIGRALVTHVMEAARAAGATAIACQATLTAVPFYTALGFREFGPITVPLAPGIDFPAVAMARSL